MRMCLAMFSVLVLFAHTAAVAADPGLVGHWKLQGDCIDYSGQGNNGINHGVDLTGKGGTSFQFFSEGDFSVEIKGEYLFVSIGGKR